MFNEVNVDNRSRQPVRGRVIVATTSLCVEFVDNRLKTSYPLYSVPEIPDGFLLVFCVELDGYLTFDPSAEVKILPETDRFRKIHYDPTAFALVRAADPPKAFVYRIAEVSNLAGSLPIHFAADNSLVSFTVRVTVPEGTPPGHDTIVFHPTTAQVTTSNYEEVVFPIFKTGSAFDLTFAKYLAAGYSNH